MNKFAIELPSYNRDPRGAYKKALVRLIENDYPELSVAGLEDPFTDRYGRKVRSIEYAGPKDILTVGTSDTHDIAFATRAEDFLRYPNTPVLDIEKDWRTVVNALDDFAASKKAKANRCYGCPFAFACKKANEPKEPKSFYIGREKVSVFGNFIKIGTVIIPKVISVPYFVAQPRPVQELIRHTIITVTRLA